MRVGAVNALGELLTGSDPGLALAAFAALREVAENDSPKVAAAARQCLASLGTDLSGQDLRDRDLSGYDLTGADPKGADLRGMRWPTPTLLAIGMGNVAQIIDAGTSQPIRVLSGHSDPVLG